MPNALRVLLAGLLITTLGLAAAAEAVRASTETRFVFATGATYDTLDPHLNADPTKIAPRINLYDALLRWVDNPAKLEPWLAQSFTVSPDGRIYSFELRQGVRFHDGTEVKAADVVYSMERLLALKQGAAPLFQPLVSPGSTKAIADYKVEFSLIKPSAAFLSIMPELQIVNKELVKKNEVNNDWGKTWLSKNAAGSGSYKLTTYDPATGFNAERFLAHWNTKWPAKPISEISFRTVQAPESRVAGLIDGTFHASGGYLEQDAIKRLREIPGVAIVEGDSMRVLQGIIHNGRDPLSDVNLRKALSHAFDFESFNKGGSFGFAVRNPLPMPATIWGAPKGVRGYPFDLEKAKEFIGRMKDPPRELTIAAVSGQPAAEQAAELLQSSLAKIGVKARVLLEPLATVTAKMRDEKQMYDILFMTRTIQQPDPASWIGELFDCDQIGKRNSSWYCNREVDKLLKDGAVAAEFETRRKNYEKATTMLVDDAAGIFVATAKWQGPYSKRVTGIRYNPVTEGQDMRWANMD